ncbi:putative transcriptional regulator, ArsR family [Aeropyrum pernix K1]|uniref:Transcriptional regulator, ArsR family n=1 Tax=Aeropyrum pernix (strain ATCC 700893 / DSM 11879 / JCM 9820 / NBRC 100138 / K1) TaxID=272557 RepID=Q9Y8X9_AERPE|nr:helix-turn-helix domain-containing protein [Aeropyrum pernix]BAA81521.1 putative transcriptional regulator, ArsR family [Aeropyrum pernix K1]
MGLLKALLGFDRRDIETLARSNEENRRRIEALEAALARLEERISSISQALGRDARSTESLQGVEKEGGRETEYEGHNGTVEEGMLEDEGIIISHLEKGDATPSELIRDTGLSKNRVYGVLKRLVERGIVEKRRDGRRVVYSLRRVEAQADAPG